MSRCLPLVLSACLLASLPACNSQSSAPSANQDDMGYDDGHGGGHDDHDHSGHSHEALGPHEGHIIEIGDEAYHVEWLHDDETGLVTLYVLDSAMKSEVPIAAKSIAIDHTVAGGEPRHHELMAVGGGDQDKSARFETTDKPLIEALKMAGQGVTASLTVEIAGQSYTADFEHSAH